MNIKEAKKAKDVFIAFCEGKQIQWKHTSDTEWKNTVDPSFCGYYDYRIKPEIKIEECAVCMYVEFGVIIIKSGQRHHLVSNFGGKDQFILFAGAFKIE